MLNGRSALRRFPFEGFATSVPFKIDVPESSETALIPGAGTESTGDFTLLES